jgi:hypothetical protein
MKRNLLHLLLLALCVGSIAQGLPKKRLGACRMSAEIRIDGFLDEPQWEAAQVGSEFIQREPNPGKKANQISEVKVLYDDEAIYIGAILYDTAPDSILMQLTARDDIGNADFFGVTFDCYQDGLNGLEFLVSAAGVQADTKFGQNTNDRAWNAVWWSNVSITEKGWLVELKIPFAALRFPELPEQEWHINFFRNIRRTREMAFWNKVDPEVDGFFNQCGLLTDLKDLAPPPRLFFYPYVSTYIENDESKGSDWKGTLNGGMDLKYGISDAFTLDMTLIPDFGQVQSDDQVLNLSPFEVQFNENRQFFTEGTDLFSKANLFYSRRIGGRPVGYFDLEDAIDEDVEEIIESPISSRLINATKVSGRTPGGLGIGVLNAVSAETIARVRTLETGEEREVVTNPLTNYNILVFDQNLWSNSYVSLINTNVFRSGSVYDANVTGTEFRLANKKNSGNFNGSAAVSQKYYSDSTSIGHAFGLELEKTSGQLAFGIRNNFLSNTYDRNDLGILFSNNQNAFEAYARYSIFEPFGLFNRMNVYYQIQYQRLHKPDVFANFGMYSEAFFITKSFQAFGGFVALEPLETYDYFEPRVVGRALNYPVNYSGGLWISSDYRKRFAIDMNADYRWFDESGRDRFNYSISPRFRFSDKLLQIVSFNRNNFDNDIGWVNEVDDDIIMGRRDLDNYETGIETAYVFNHLMSLSFRLRHNWTRVKYSQYELLQENGYTSSTDYEGLEDDGTSSHNTNFNAFNIDMVYRWVFSPGSEVSIVWKNSLLGEDEQLLYSYTDDVERTFDFDQVNSFSIKVLYFLDYRSLKGNHKKREPIGSLDNQRESSRAQRLNTRRVM